MELNRGQSFSTGAGCVLRGVVEFYTHPKLWKYAIPPLLILLLLFAVILFSVFYWCIPAALAVLKGITFPEWLNWLRRVLEISAWVVLPLASALLFLVILGSLYEMLGGIMFDGLLAAFESAAFPNLSVPKLPAGTNFELVLGSVGYGLTSGVKMVLLLILSFCIPVVGPFLYFLYAGYVYSLSYLSGSAARQGVSIRSLRTKAKPCRSALLGFGVMANVVLLIPFMILVIMPGLVIGGSMLYHKVVAQDA